MNESLHPLRHERSPQHHSPFSPLSTVHGTASIALSENINLAVSTRPKLSHGHGIVRP